MLLQKIGNVIGRSYPEKIELRTTRPQQSQQYPSGTGKEGLLNVNDADFGPRDLWYRNCRLGSNP